jgi:phenylacetic acid degradation operon negative regulatory protein
VTEPKLSARSVILSTLLGTDPPELPVSALVAVTDLFGLGEGTVRTSLSRMTARGEITTGGDGRYRLAGALLARQSRQSASRHAERLEWPGGWRQLVVTADGRDAATRAALRRGATELRLAEQREGVWMRPDNLPADRAPAARAVVDAQGVWATIWPDRDSGELAAALWDLDGWSRRATELRREMAGLQGRLDGADTDALAPGFVVSAAVLRHFQADPLLPDELLGRSWPGARLRIDYDRFDDAYRRVLRTWLTAPERSRRSVRS